MNSPAILQRHPGLRWLVPLGIACIAGLAAAGIFKVDDASSESLPATTPTALIAAVQDNHVEGFSGTVVSHVSLGLPELPTPARGSDEMSFNALLSGSHTMQVWYGGGDKQRIALIGATEEADLFRDGRSVWQWSSADRTAVHSQLPARVAPGSGVAALPAALDPVTLARRALAAIDPSTEVTVENNQVVAERSAYELILTPRTTATKIGSVHVLVDGATKVPLGVQVYPRGSSAAAIDVSFTSIHFGPQAERNFSFTPPPDARVRHVTIGDSGDHHAQTTGTGWTTVVQVPAPRAAVSPSASGALYNQLTPVAGSWGKGRLLDSPLLSVLVTANGRIFAGAVEPSDLYAAAGSR